MKQLSSGKSKQKSKTFKEGRTTPTLQLGQEGGRKLDRTMCRLELTRVGLSHPIAPQALFGGEQAWTQNLSIQLLGELWGTQVSEEGIFYCEAEEVTDSFGIM